VLQALQARRPHCAGLLFPLSLAAEGSCTIGGNLATNAGGTQVLRYGNARELCLGLEVVTAEGEVWDGLSGLRKDNTGYDLRDLFIGSEGTLGIITAATLKLARCPAATPPRWPPALAGSTGVELLNLAHPRLGAGLTGFEVMGRFALDLVRRHFPALPAPLPGRPLDRAAGAARHRRRAQARERFEALLGARWKRGCVSDAVVAESLAQARALWHVRESIPLAQAEEGLNIKHDISVPVSAIPTSWRRPTPRCRPPTPACGWSTSATWATATCTTTCRRPKAAMRHALPGRAGTRVNTIVFDAVARFGGSISAEHGIGALKRDELAARKSPVALQLMRAIKQPRWTRRAS
jgi:FAD/FMN-containing dehydrogenase